MTTGVLSKRRMSGLVLPNSREAASSAVLPVTTPTFLPARSFRLLTVLLWFTAISWRASKYGAVKSYDCLRLSLIVTPEITRSTSPLFRAAKMPVQGVSTMRICSPAFWATARIMSMS